MTIAKWDLFELTLKGPEAGNPFVDVQLSATFRCLGRALTAEGFYDGDGAYKVRLMPDFEGEWTYETRSNAPELDGKTGGFTCGPAKEGVHGPVVVDSVGKKLFGNFGMTTSTRFAYADGTDYQPVGTTCYVWNLQGDELEEQTLRTLAGSPFNKIRFCVFPKHYDFNHNEPPCYAYEGSREAGFDYARFNPEYFRHLELRVGQLRDLGIEADLILLHPYDDWGFKDMPHEADLRYFHYIVARLAAYRNIWWSFANEYDLMPSKSLTDWDEFMRLVQAIDPSNHLRSIHNCFGFYDHAKPWVTHCSVQHSDLTRVSEWMEQYRKPVVVDECCYEGNITHPWGNITAEEMVNRFWIGFSRGAYVGHGETYMDENDVLWWAKGGTLKGESPERIAFLRTVFENMPGKPVPSKADFGMRGGIEIGEDFFLHYYDIRQQVVKRLRLPEDKQYQVEVIDAWNMTITPLDGTYSGACEVPMPGKPYCGLRITKV